MRTTRSVKSQVTLTRTCRSLGRLESLRNNAAKLRARVMVGSERLGACGGGAGGFGGSASGRRGVTVSRDWHDRRQPSVVKARAVERRHWLVPKQVGGV